MEFRRARLDEAPDPWLVERHEREIFPLLHRRAWFAEAHDFLLYDLVTDGGGVDEDVLAYSNGIGPTRSLVVYHVRFGSTAGTIRESAPFARKSASGAKRLVRRSLAEGLGLPDDPVGVRGVPRRADGARVPPLVPRDPGTRPVARARRVPGPRVLGVPRGPRRDRRPVARLAERLGGAGVPSLEDALANCSWSRSTPRSERCSRAGTSRRSWTGAARPGGPRRAGGAASRRSSRPSRPRPASPATRPRWPPTIRDDVEAAFRGRCRGAGRGDRPATSEPRCWLYSSCPDWAAWPPAPTSPRPSPAWYDELRLAPIVADGLRSGGLDEDEAWSVADTVRSCWPCRGHPRSAAAGRQRDARLLDRWLALRAVREALGVNTWEGAEWLDRDRFALAARLGGPARRDRDGRRPPDTARREAVPGGRRGRRLPRRPAPGGPQRGWSSASKRRAEARRRTPRIA